MSADYYEHERREMLPYLPTSPSAILEPGCAGGAFGRVLREAFPGARIVGVEPTDAAERAQASQVYDTMVRGSFPEDVPPGRFDCMVLNDVLEHLVDPWAALALSRESLLTADATVVASIPNVRHWPVLTGLLRGRWDYTDSGVLDRTHLRFFTRDGMVGLFESTGYRVEKIERLRGYTGSPKFRLMGMVAPSFAHDTATMQYVVVARPGR